MLKKHQSEHCIQYVLCSNWMILSTSMKLILSRFMTTRSRLYYILYIKFVTLNTLWRSLFSFYNLPVRGQSLNVFFLWAHLATGHMSFLYHLVSVINFSHILISCKTIQLKPNLTGYGIILRNMRGNTLLSKFHVACNGQFMNKIFFLKNQ